MKNSKIFFSLYKLGFYFFKIFRTFPTIMTPEEQLNDLVNKLRPINSGIALIRFGSKGDGGYLIPDDLLGIEACFSPGVERKSDFEKDCAEFGMKVFLADYSVDGPSTENDNFIFVKKYIGAVTSDSFMTINDWVTSTLPDAKLDLLLQIDIEGYEYETFISMADDLLNRFRIIVVEFHHLDLLWSKPFFRLASPAFYKILKNHTCVHIHPNNASPIIIRQHGLVIPSAMEFTFLRNDRVKSKTYANIFPHPLDFDNTINSCIILPKCWYEQ